MLTCIHTYTHTYMRMHMHTPMQVRCTARFRGKVVATLEHATGGQRSGRDIRHVVDFTERIIVHQPAGVELDVSYTPELSYVFHDPCLTDPSMMQGAWSFAAEQSGAGLPCIYCNRYLCFGVAAFQACMCGYGGQLARDITGAHAQIDNQPNAQALPSSHTASSARQERVP